MKVYHCSVSQIGVPDNDSINISLTFEFSAPLTLDLDGFWTHFTPEVQVVWLVWIPFWVQTQLAELVFCTIQSQKDKTHGNSEICVICVVLHWANSVFKVDFVMMYVQRSNRPKARLSLEQCEWRPEGDGDSIERAAEVSVNALSHCWWTMLAEIICLLDLSGSVWGDIWKVDVCKVYKSKLG